MDHDHMKENWSRTTNHYAGCSCPVWRYNPLCPKPTNPLCPEHGADTEGTS